MQALKLHRIAVVFCFMYFHSGIYSQKTPYLERPVTLKIYNQSLSEVFKAISAQTDVIFSYTSFDDQQKVSVNHYRKPLRLVLNDLLKETNCSYKLKDKYIILRCSDKPKEESPTMLHLSGYVYNAADSSRVANASIYIRENKHSATTNQYGYFSFSFPKKGTTGRVSVAKENFRDTTITVSVKNKLELTIFIRPGNPNAEIYASIDPKMVTVLAPDYEKDSVPVATTIEKVPVKYHVPMDTTFHNLLISGFNFWEKLKTNNMNMRNVSDTLFQTVSFSLVPYVSTNRLLSINTLNKYSFNLLAGESKGVDIFELGALLNIDNGNVKYGQIAGLVNVVSGNVTGGQVGGLVNYVGKDVTGIQIGGLTNVVKGNVTYVQVGGLANVVNGDFKGVQVGGIFNKNRKTTGAQVGGFVSLSDNLNGIQVGGIASQVNHKLNGVQIGGLVNVADTVNGAQISGFINHASVMNGFQLAGFVNSTRQMKGVQLSFMNFSNTCAGVPIGFFSYVHKGYHKIELASDEQLFGTIAFRTGVDQFHNIFFGGISMQRPNNLWTYGYGIGSALKLSPKWYLDIDLTAQQIQSTNQPDIYLNMLNKVFLGAEFRPFKKINLAFGPTYNVFVSEVSESNTIPGQISSSDFFNLTEDNVNIRMWVGGKVCLRFL